MAVEQTDAQLVSRCRQGDPEAWNEFVERFSRYVFAICSRGFRLAEPDAEDVFQEVFARAFERLADLRSDDAVRPWLAQLTRRLCIDKLRLLARDTPSDADPDEREVDDVLAALDDAMTVRAALDKVGDPCREILDRFFCRDESYRTIGDVLDMPAGTVASRISRCLDKVRSELDGRSRGSRPS
ncbi:MAG TPA: sigma-70 family RNA polymerase sigma factor [Gaiellaceae bacterium]|nr:sigma-70 family RNA polymerase sigma factor [Gaiellaceae bacterium]